MNGDLIMLDQHRLSCKLLDGVVGVVNMLSANQYSVETDTTGFTSVGTTMTKSATYFKYTANSLKNICNNAAAGEGFFTNNLTVVASNPVIVSVWLRGAVGGETVILSNMERTTGDALVGQTDSPVITLTTTFTRYSVKRIYGATGVNARLYVLTNVQQAATFYADGLMIEQSDNLSETQDATTISSPWIEIPAWYNIRSFWTDLTAEGSSATIDIMVSNALTKPSGLTDAPVARTITGAANGGASTATESYRWVKAKKTPGSSPVATICVIEAARNE